MTQPTLVIYAGGPLYDKDLVDETVANIKSSGITTVAGWNIFVDELGDFYFNIKANHIIANGKYVGEVWEDTLQDMKTGGSVETILLSLGSSLPDTFSNLQQLIQTQGCGPDSVLYKNFAALKAALPAVDGIDFDDEALYDRETTVPLALMLGQLGYKVTFCPYTRMDFWVQCAQEIHAQRPDLLLAFNLQCYSGGSGNQPSTWIEALRTAGLPDIPVYPGLAGRSENAAHQCTNGMWPQEIQQTLGGWASSKLDGAFLWLYDSVRHCQQSPGPSDPRTVIKAYADAMRAGLGG